MPSTYRPVMNTFRSRRVTAFIVMWVWLEPVSISIVAGVPLIVPSTAGSRASPT